MQPTANKIVPPSPHLPLTPSGSRLSKWIYRFIVIALMAAHFLLTWDILRRQTPTVDEIAHLPSGLTYLETGTFRLYRHNPPLVKVLAGLAANMDPPVLRFDASWAQFEPANHWVFAFETLAANAETQADRNRYLDAFTRSRLVITAWSTLTIPVLYLWGAWWFGRNSGLLAAALWSICPNILANAGLVTTDVPAASTCLIVAYLFARWLDRPGWIHATLVGVALGIAQLVKFTSLSLYVILLLWALAVWLARKVFRRPAPGAKSAPTMAIVFQVGLILLLSLFVINAGYRFEGTFTRLGDYAFLSRALTRPRIAMDPPPPATQNELYKQVWQRRTNIFARTPLALLPCPLPYHYLAGFDQQKFDSESTYPMYLRGQLARPTSPEVIFRHDTAGERRGWWYYYFYALMLKIPLGTWLLLMASTAMVIVPAFQHSGPKTRRFRHVATLAFLALVPILAMSFLTDINIGVRYVLVAFPFLFLWASSLVADGRSWTWLAVAGIALVINILSVARVHPHEFSYFNELTGATSDGEPSVNFAFGNGPRFGRLHLIDSNIDWGQDLRSFSRWLDQHPEWKDSVRFAYFGSVPPEFEGIEFYRLAPRDLREVVKANQPAFPSEDPNDPSTWGPHPGKYAVSVNFERGLRFHTPCPREDAKMLFEERQRVGSPRHDWPMFEVPRESYAYFQHFTPIIVPEIGYSILLYDISLDEANRVRKEIGLPPLSASEAP